MYKINDKDTRKISLTENETLSISYLLSFYADKP